MKNKLRYLGFLIIIPYHFLYMEIFQDFEPANDIEYYIKLPILIFFSLIWFAFMLRFNKKSYSKNQYRFFYFPFIIGVPAATLISLYDHVLITYQGQFNFEFEFFTILINFIIFYSIFAIVGGGKQYELYKAKLK